MPGNGEGRPGDVEPTGASEELVGVFAMAEKIDKALELGWVLGEDVGSLAEQVLGILHATHEAVHPAVAETAGDDNRAHLLTGRLQQHQTAVGHVHHLLHRGLVGRVLLPVAELRQGKMIRESCVFHSSFC